MITEFPRVPYTQPPTPLCDSHYEEVPATRSIHFEALPGTADAHGSTIDICADQACEDKALALVDDFYAGDVIEIVALVTAVGA